MKKSMLAALAVSLLLFPCTVSAQETEPDTVVEKPTESANIKIEPLSETYQVTRTQQTGACHTTAYVNVDMNTGYILSGGAYTKEANYYVTGVKVTISPNKYSATVEFTVMANANGNTPTKVGSYAWVLKSQGTM